LRRGPLLAALFAAALTLRPQLVGVGPLIPSIRDALHTSHAVAGLLATIPVLCMGLFAPPAAFLSRRLGARHALTGVLALIGLAGLLRAVAPGAELLVLLTFPLGIGMGLGNALLPVGVKERFADRPAFATGIYAVGITLGATVAAAAAVPLADVLGSWRWPLAVYSGLTVLVLALWLVLTRHETPHVSGSIARPLTLPWRSRLGWQLVASFVFMASIYYGLNAWLPDAYVERGWSEGHAGALLAVLNAVQIPIVLAVGWAADRVGSRRAWLVAFSVILLVGLLGVVLFPGAGYLWAVLLGAGNGPLFSLTMALPLDVGHGPAEVAAFTGLMLGAGYTLSAIAPFLLGAIRDATHGYDAVFWVLAGLAVARIAMDLSLTSARLAAGRGYGST
jgi:MFS transporter, CP family, cyanate transporter